MRRGKKLNSFVYEIRIFQSFRQALIIKRYRRSPSPKGEVMSSRPRDMHLPPGQPRLSPEAAALIPREPEAKVHNNIVF